MSGTKLHCQVAEIVVNLRLEIVAKLRSEGVRSDTSNSVASVDNDPGGGSLD